MNTYFLGAQIAPEDVEIITDPNRSITSDTVIARHNGIAYLLVIGERITSIRELNRDVDEYENHHPCFYPASLMEILPQECLYEYHGGISDIETFEEELEFSKMMAGKISSYRIGYDETEVLTYKVKGVFFPPDYINHFFTLTVMRINGRSSDDITKRLNREIKETFLIDDGFRKRFTAFYIDWFITIKENRNFKLKKTFLKQLDVNVERHRKSNRHYFRPVLDEGRFVKNDSTKLMVGDIPIVAEKDFLLFTEKGLKSLEKRFNRFPQFPKIL